MLVQQGPGANLCILYEFYLMYFISSVTKQVFGVTPAPPSLPLNISTPARAAIGKSRTIRVCYTRRSGDIARVQRLDWRTGLSHLQKSCNKSSPHDASAGPPRDSFLVPLRAELGSKSKRTRTDGA